MDTFVRFVRLRQFVGPDDLFITNMETAIGWKAGARLLGQSSTECTKKVSSYKPGLTILALKWTKMNILTLKIIISCSQSKIFFFLNHMQPNTALFTEVTIRND